MTIYREKNKKEFVEKSRIFLISLDFFGNALSLKHVCKYCFLFIETFMKAFECCSLDVASSAKLAI